jgi:hypothetical protein
MTDKDWMLPPFYGEPGEKYRTWRNKILWQFASVPDDKQHLFAPRVVGTCLQGDAAELYKDKDAASYRTKNGLENLLKDLDNQYGTYAEIEMFQAVSTFFFRLRRHGSETATTFASRFKTSASRMEGLVQAELKKEYNDKVKTLAKSHKEQFLQFAMDRQVFQDEQAKHETKVVQLQQQINAFGQLQQDGDENAEATLADLQEQLEALENTALEEPKRPKEPAVPEVANFKLPGILLGALFLHAMGLAPDTVQNLVRNAQGRTHIDDMIRLLRASELSRGRPKDSGYMGEEWEDEEDEDWSEGDDDDEGYYEEEGEEEWPEEDEDHDAELEQAMVSFKDARRKLLDLRKARGFAPPGERAPDAMFERPWRPGFSRKGRKGKGKGKRKGKGKKRKGSNTGKASPPPYWKVQKLQEWQ